MINFLNERNSSEYWCFSLRASAFSVKKKKLLTVSFHEDVTGIMEVHDPVGKFKNRNGGIQQQIKFNITDGREKLKEEKEYPMIFIISCGRIQKWGDELVISNVGATTTYLNCGHHSVAEMRKTMPEKDFSQSKLSTPISRCTACFNLKDLKMLGTEYIDREVFCEVQIKKFQNLKPWCHTICTSCNQKTSLIENEETCLTCHRTVPYGDKIFEIYTEVVDDTGSVILILQDREVRTLVGKRALQLFEEGTKEDILPDSFKALENKYYTVKLFVFKNNIVQKDECYLARDIMHGLYSQSKQKQQESYPHPIDDMNAEPYGSSYQTGSVTTYNLASDS